MKKISVILSVMILLIGSACAPKFAPRISFENASKNEEVVRDVKVNWNGYHLLGSSLLSMCNGSSQSHYIKNFKNFFGPVQVSWKNAQGKEFSKTFTITKKDLPSYSKWTNNTGKYVELFFTQTDVEYYTSDHPDIKKIRSERSQPCLRHVDKRKARIRKEKEEEYVKKHGHHSEWYLENLKD